MSSRPRRTARRSRSAVGRRSLNTAIARRSIVSRPPVDVATFEFENIPAEAVLRVAASKPVLPRPEILEITQDRLREKDFLRSIEIPTTAYREISDATALARAMHDFGYPAVLKSVRMGYDGKGQVTLTPEIKPGEAWRQMGGEIGILEAFVDFACEISVIVARGRNGSLGDLPAGREPAQPITFSIRRLHRLGSRLRPRCAPRRSPATSPKSSISSACWRSRCS